MNAVNDVVRPATLADVDEVCATVAAAFADDPAWSFIIGSDNPATRHAFASRLLIPRIHRTTAWVTEDCTAVAMWDRRSTSGPLDDDEDEWWSAFRIDVGAAISSRLDEYDRALGALNPREPYWYLGVLATHPDHQGQGLATAVLRPGLAAADADGWDCWLETSTPANKSFYAGRGFTDAVAVDIPAGPPTWWLRRPAPTAGRA